MRKAIVLLLATGLIHADMSSDRLALEDRVKFRLEMLKNIRDAYLLAAIENSPELELSQLIKRTFHNKNIASEAILITIFQSPATNPTEVKIKEILSIYLAQKEALLKRLP